MAEAGGVFGLCLNESRESVVLPMVVEALEEFDDSVLDAFGVGVCRRPHHRFEDVDGGGEGVGDLVQGSHDVTGKESDGAFSSG